MNADIDNLDDLRERVASYRDLAELATTRGMPELSRHADSLATKYETELRNAHDTAWTADTYIVPTDPADNTNCEACQ